MYENSNSDTIFLKMFNRIKKYFKCFSVKIHKKSPKKNSKKISKKIQKKFSKKIQKKCLKISK